MVTKLVGLLVTRVLGVVGRWAVLRVVRATTGLRVDPDAEREGLDLNQHGEEGYIFL